MKANYWRIWNFINTTLRAWNRQNYLEVGGNGKICRMVKGNTEIVFDPIRTDQFPALFANYVWQVSIEDFLLLWAVQKKGAYAVILLREWDESNLEDRVKGLYEMLRSSGVLIVERFDKTGEKNEAWRVAGALKKQGHMTVILRDKFFLVYKGSPIEGSIKLKIKKSTFMKNPEKYLP